MKLFFLFVGMSLLMLNGVKAAPYECFLPNLKNPVATFDHLRLKNESDVAAYCNTDKTIKEKCNGRCTGKPAPLKKSGFF